MKHSTSTAWERLPLWEVVSYGAGDMACSMVFNFMSSYLLYFYTDVAGIAVGAAGAVMSAARLIDAAANPVVGVLSDKTQTRWGKLRPYLLFSAVPLALSVVLMFTAAWVPQGGRPGYALATYALFCVLYTLCNVPYSAMLPNISEDPRQRGRLNMSRFVLASMGALVSMGLALPLAGLFGQGDERRGFFGLALLFAGVIIVFVLICFANTKERVQPPPVAFSLKNLGQTVKKSKPWVLFCAVQLFHYIALTTRNSSALYYAKYCLGNAGFASLLLAVNAFATLAAALFVPVLTAKVTKRSISMFGYVLFAAGSLLTYWAGQNLTAIFLLNVLANLGICLPAGGLLPDFGGSHRPFGVCHRNPAAGAADVGLYAHGEAGSGHIQRGVRRCAGVGRVYCRPGSKRPSARRYPDEFHFPARYSWCGVRGIVPALSFG